MSIKLVCGCLLLSLLGEVSAQSYFNVLSLNSSISPENGYQHREGDLTIQNLGGTFQMPLNLGTNNLLLFGVSGSKTNFIHTSSNEEQSRLHLSAYVLQLGWQKIIKPGKKRLLMLIPSIKSDFKEVDGNDYQLGFVVLYTKKVNTKLKVKYGLYANTEYFGPFFNPLLGLDYSMNNNWRLFGTLPSYLTLEKKINTRLRTGIDLRLGTSTFRFSENVGNSYLQQNLNVLSGFMEAYPQKLLALRFSVGHSVFRKYEAYASNEKNDFNILGIGIGQKRQVLTSDGFGEVKNGLVFGVSLFIRMEID